MDWGEFGKNMIGKKMIVLLAVTGAVYFFLQSESLEGTPLEVTHINLLDQTIEGVACPQDRAFSVQYHPESAPGPQDSRYLFRQFVAYMEEGKRNAETY